MIGPVVTGERSIARAHRGAVLLVVLGMLAILSLLGVTFVAYCSMEKRSATRYAQALRNEDLRDVREVPGIKLPPKVVLEFALNQLRFNSRLPHSALNPFNKGRPTGLTGAYNPATDGNIDDDRFESLLEDMFGLDYIAFNDDSITIRYYDQTSGTTKSQTWFLDEGFDFPGPVLVSVDTDGDGTTDWPDPMVAGEGEGWARNGFLGAFGPRLPTDPKENVRLLASSFRRWRETATSGTSRTFDLRYTGEQGDVTEGATSRQEFVDNDGDGIPGAYKKTEDTNGNGILDPGEDKNGNGVLDVYDNEYKNAGLDSRWLDLDHPVIIGMNGMRIKPHYAILTVDLDGRGNLNAHGNYANGVGTDPHASHQGHAPSEINLSRIFDLNDDGVIDAAEEAEYRAVMAGIGTAATNDFIPGRWREEYPNSSPGKPGIDDDGSAAQNTDTKDRLDQNANAAFEYDDRGLVRESAATAGKLNDVGEGIDKPDETQLYEPTYLAKGITGRLFDSLTDTNNDGKYDDWFKSDALFDDSDLFTLLDGELRRVRWSSGSPSLASAAQDMLEYRLSGRLPTLMPKTFGPLATSSLSNPMRVLLNRASVTHRSWDTRYFSYNDVGTLRNALRTSTDTINPWNYPAFIPVWDQGLRLDLNLLSGRPWDVDSSSVKQDPGHVQYLQDQGNTDPAYNGSKHLAKALYDLMAKVLPTNSGTVTDAERREWAQYALNIADYIDADYDVTVMRASDFGATFDDTADYESSDPGLRGVEQPVVITEVLASSPHDALYVEIFNPTKDDISLKKWELVIDRNSDLTNNTGETYAFRDTDIIRAGNYFVMGNNQTIPLDSNSANDHTPAITGDATRYYNYQPAMGGTLFALTGVESKIWLRRPATLGGTPATPTVWVDSFAPTIDTDDLSQAAMESNKVTSHERGNYYRAQPAPLADSSTVQAANTAIIPGQILHTLGQDNSNKATAADSRSLFFFPTNRAVNQPNDSQWSRIPSLGSLSLVPRSSPQKLTTEVNAGLSASPADARYFIDWLNVNPLPAGITSPQNMDLFKLLEFLEVRSPHLRGDVRRLTKKIGTTEPQHNPRIPGKININTAFSRLVTEGLIDLTDPETGLNRPTTRVKAISDQLLTSRGWPDKTYDTANPAYQPFQGFASDLMLGGTTTAVDFRKNSLLRFITGGPGTTDPIWRDLSAAVPHPFLADHAWRKCSNLVTTRSSVFAVWMTVGFFKESTPGSNDFDTEIGKSNRIRAFFILDRSTARLTFDDKNGNGVRDLGEDLNGNGILDPAEDTNGNGVLDPGEDKNGNGVLDPSEDTNGNGILDTERIIVLEPIAIRFARLLPPLE